MYHARPCLITAAALSLSASVLLTGCGGTSEASEVLGTSSASPTAISSSDSTAYEPATPEHPARNVPKPVLPEKAKENNEEGARAFLEYWAECVNYMVETGDPGPLKAVLGKANHKYDKPMRAYAKYYKEGKWSAGTQQLIELRDHTYRDINEYKAFNVILSRSSGALYNTHGRVDDVPADGNGGEVLVALVSFTPQGWKLAGFQKASELRGR